MDEQQEALHYTFNMKRFVFIILATILALFSVSCSGGSEDGHAQDKDIYPVDTTCYASTVVELPMRSSIMDISLLENKYYVLLSLYDDESLERTSKLIVINDGSIEQEHELDLYANAACMLDKTTAVIVTSAEAFMIDVDSGETIRQLDVSHSGYSEFPPSVIPDNDGFVVVFDGFLARFDLEGNLLNRMVSDQINDVIGYSNGSLLMDSLNPGIYSIDWKSNSIKYVAPLFSEPGEYVDYYLAGTQMLSVVSHDLFDVNFGDISKIKTVSGDNTLFYPGKAGSNDKRFISIDKNHYAILYNENGTDVVLSLIQPEPELDLIKREKIVVGGVGFRNDPYFESLRYNYNSSQNEYFIVTRDYGIEQGSEEPMQAFQLRLLRDFNDGNTPDIFYGTMFDYDYLGRNGIVINLIPLFDADPQISLDDLQPFIRDQLVNDDGSCFRMISGYYTVGFIGMRDSFPVNEVSIYDMPDLDEGQQLLSGSSPAALIKDAIIFALPEIMERNRIEYGTAGIYPEQMKDIIEYALCNGNSQGDYYSYGSMDDVFNDRVLLSDEAFMISQLNLVHSDYMFGGRQLAYVGYPSIYGSIHPAYPSLQMGISASADNPGACWSFISSILADDFQISLLSGATMRYPVISSVMDGFIDCALECENINQDSPYYDALVNIGLFSDDQNTCTQSDLMTYLEFGENVDVICYHDYGIAAIVDDEMDDYYSSGKPIEEIAESMSSRINLYYQENYT